MSIHRPPLVLEIGIDSLEYCRLNASIYAEAEVKEYWIVRPDVKTVEVYRHPKDQSCAERTEMTALVFGEFLWPEPRSRTELGPGCSP